MRAAVLFVVCALLSSACPRVPDHGVEYTLVAGPTGKASPQQLQQAADVIERRMNALKVRGSRVWIDGERIVVRIPGAKVSDGSTWMGQTAILEFWRLDDADNPFEKWTASGHIDNAEVERTDHGWPAVLVQLDETGTKRFAEMTTAHVGKKIAIVYNGEVMSEPVVREPITEGSVMITLGMFSQIDREVSERHARELAAVFRGGALPISLILLEAAAY